MAQQIILAMTKYCLLVLEKRVNVGFTGEPPMQSVGNNEYLTHHQIGNTDNVPA